jgi:hypothetical protein
VATGPDVALLAIGGAASAVGVGLLVTGIVIAAGSERCVSGCEGPAIDRVVAVPSTELGIGLAIGGGVALGVGIVMVIIGATSSGPSTVALGSDGLRIRF